MDKKREELLDVLSEMDDEILERTSQKRFFLAKALQERIKKRNRRIIGASIAAGALAAVILLSVLLLPLFSFPDGGGGGLPGPGKQIPIYLGMTVSDHAPNVSTAKGGEERILLSRGAWIPLGAAERADGLPSFEAALGELLNVPEGKDDLYYAKKKADIYITVHLDNPDEFEIVSFTLGGVKYTSYMFEDGSDLENLVIKVNVGDVEGVIDYTVDQLKYIDNTEIKDVRMDGERTVSVVITPEEQPTAAVEVSADFHSITAGVAISDPNGLIGKEEPCGVYACLRDRAGSIRYVKLSDGVLSVCFDELLSGAAYELCVVGVYNGLDGQGVALHTLYSQTVETEWILQFGQVNVTGDRAEFSLLWNEAWENPYLEALTLILPNGSEEPLDASATSVSGLSENGTYRLRATYLSDVGEESVECSFAVGMLHTIFFETNGGEALEARLLGTADLLPLPTREGFTFGGWYTGADFNAATLMSAPPAESCTLYARWAEEDRPDVFLYTVRSDGITVTGVVSKTAKTLRIPTYIGGIPVTEIGEGAFEGYTNLVSLILPDGLTAIGARAFAGCERLCVLTIPQGVTSIGKNAFLGCTSLTPILPPLVENPEGEEPEDTEAPHVHVPTAPVRENEMLPTCTAEGTYDEVVYCADCGEELSREAFTLPMLSHTYDQTVVGEAYLQSAATCTAPACYHYSCICGAKGSGIFESGEALGHTYRDVWTFDETHHWREATCAHTEETTRKEEHRFGDDLLCDVCRFARERDEIRFTTLRVNGTNVYGTVSNATTTFSFLEEIVTGGEATYTVSSDISGTPNMASRIVTLESGDNVFYVIATVDGAPEVYTVTIRRRPLYTVSFETNGGNAIAEQTVEEGSVAALPEAPKRTGYTFAGWSHDFTAAVMKDTVVSAAWTANVYTVTYDPFGGAVSTASQSVTYGTAFSLARATRNGYTFLGWYDGNGQKIVDGVWETLADVMLTARWSPITYSISYALNGGTHSGNPTTYTVESERITLVSPTRAGYTFTGWTWTGQNTPTVNAVIETGSRGTKSYTAHWTPNTYTIHYLPDGGTVERTEQAVTYSMAFSLEIPTRDGYRFLGWYLDGVQYTESVWKRTADIILTAKWELIKYKVSISATPAGVGTVAGGGTYAPQENVTVTATGNLGYTFVGWLDADGALCSADRSYTFPMGNGNVELVAKWEVDAQMANFAFTSTETACTITGVKNSALATYVIPDCVTEIGDNAFSSCTGLIYITVPESVKRIGERAFASCTGLDEVIIEGGVESIGEYAFYNCTGLCSLTLPEGLREIERGAFAYCSALAEITLPSTLSHVGNYAFEECSALARVNVTDPAAWCGIEFGDYDANPLYCGAGLYVNGALVTELNVPEGVTRIGPHAFEGYSKLTRVTLPEGLLSIEIGAFRSTKITEIVIPASVERIGNSAFSSSDLVYVTFAQGSRLQTIERYAFSSCPSLVSLAIPEGVTSIGYAVLEHCVGIEELTIPASMVSCEGSMYGEVLGDVSPVRLTAPTHALAWVGMERLESVTLNGGTAIPAAAFQGCTTLTSIAIPEGVATIAARAFEGCTGLRSIALPMSLGSIRASAFEGCTALTTVTYAGSASTWAGVEVAAGNESLTEAFLYCEEIEDDPIYSDPEGGIDAYSDLGGYTYRAYVRSKNSGNGAFACEDFWTDSYDTALSYAVYSRNADIEATYHCSIVQVDSQMDSMYEEMKQFKQAGDAYELSILLDVDSVSCATAGLLRNLYDAEHLVLENPVYDPNSIRQLTLGGALYFLSGDMNVSAMDCATVTVFNAALLGEYDFEAVLGSDAYSSIYQMVKEGAWTVDAMLAMATVFNNDADNNGGTLDATLGDTVGYFQYTASPLYYFYGCGARISKTDVIEGGTPTVAYGDAGVKEIVDFLYERMNLTLNPERAQGDGSLRQSFWQSGQTLFTDEILCNVRKIYRPSDQFYGILPIPKYSEEQGRYFSMVDNRHGTLHLWSIPRVCQNADYASFLFHVMAVSSARTDSTRNAYERSVLSVSAAEDSEARDVLRKIRYSLTYDLGLSYSNISYDLSTQLGTADENRYAEATTKEAIDAEQAELDTAFGAFLEKGSDCLRYSRLADGTYEVTGGGEYMHAEIVIPTFYNGVPVTSIGLRSFEAYFGSSITLPETIEHIGQEAFQWASISSITLPEGLKSIDACAFYECGNLEQVILPYSLKSIGEKAFGCCPSLEEIVLPDGLESIGDNAFNDCPLSSVTLPASLKHIGKNAFEQTVPIYFDGTIEQWNAVDKGNPYETDMNATVHCTDGDSFWS